MLNMQLLVTDKNKLWSYSSENTEHCILCGFSVLTQQTQLSAGKTIKLLHTEHCKKDFILLNYKTSQRNR